MEQTCKICGVIKTENPDMCDYCHASINTLDYIKRLLYNMKDSKDGTAIATLLENLSLIKRDATNGRTLSIEYSKGDHGERMPGFLHAPYMSKYTDKYAYPGGLLKFISEMINYHDTAVKKDLDGFLRTTILHSIKHAIGAYQYVEPNGPGATFKRVRGNLTGGAQALVNMSSGGISIRDDDILFLMSEEDRVVGINANVLAGIITLTRGT